MKKGALLLVAVAMLTSASGCYCGSNGFWPFWGGYGPSYYGGGCPGGNCGVVPGVAPLGVPPQGTYLPRQGVYQSYDSIQAGYPLSTPGPVVIGPVIQPAGIPQTAFAPLDPLPTY